MKRGSVARWMVYGMMLGTALFFVFAAAGCRSLDGYRRSYTLAAVDRFGQRVEIGMTLEPREALALATEMHQKGQGVKEGGQGIPGELAKVGVRTDAAVLRPDAPVDGVALEPGAEVLDILTAADAVRSEREKGPRVVMPPSPSEVMVWLARDGKLRLETDAAQAAMYRAAGWRDAPPPGFDAEGGYAPAWRDGRWVVKKVGRVR